MRSVILFFSLLWAQSALAGGVLVAWAPTDLPGMSQARFEAAKGRSAAETLALLDSAKTWPETYEVVLGAKQHTGDAAFMGQLVERLADTRVTELGLTYKLVLWERIATGQVLFAGTGLHVEDDLFSVAGRANWTLSMVTGVRYGVVTPQSRPDELAALQERWRQHLAGTPPEPWSTPYPSDKRGLEELRSPAAVHALVVSLQPSPAKDAATAECLQRVYRMKRMPKDPSHPANMCSSDTMANSYLEQITDVKGPLTPDAWKAWWEAHGSALCWSEARTRFQTDCP